MYFRVPAAPLAATAPRPGTMAAHLQIRSGSPCTSWLWAEVNRRYDHACVADAPDLASRARAVTRAGQIKDNARHEKDDRQRAGDRRHYVLGWDTAARRTALQQALTGALAAVSAAEQAASTATAARTGHNDRGYALKEIATRFPDPAAVDVASALDAVTAAQELHDTIAARRSWPSCGPSRRRRSSGWRPSARSRPGCSGSWAAPPIGWSSTGANTGPPR